MKEEEYEHKVKHIHENKDDFLKEFVIQGLNFSVYLKSNLSSDSLKSMSELGLDVMKDVKELEGK